MVERLPTSRTGRVVALVILVVALAYIEAAVVVYLREVLAPARMAHFPDAVREPLPLLSYARLEQAGGEIASLLKVEVIREVAALGVLFGVALGFRRRAGEFLGFFLLGFALWDIFYYVFLKMLLGWPASPATWDILFLIPVPWVAPVWAPLMVSAVLLVTGAVVLRRAGRTIKTKKPLGAYLVILVGTAGILASFFLRTSEAFGSVPQRFDWPWFLAGWLLGVVGLVWLLGGSSSRRSRL